MNYKVTTSILLLSPSLSWASGGDVLSLLWLNLLVFLIVIISLFLAHFPTKQKLTVFIVYFIANAVALISTSDMPYSNNIYLINTVSTAVPFIAWLVTYLHYHKKHNKSSNLTGAKNAPPS